MVRTGWKTFLAVLPAVLLLAPAASAADASLESAPAGQTTLADNPFAPPPLSEECTEFCGLCAEETGKGKKKNGMCERVEAKCGCAAHAEAMEEAERLLARKAAKDSAERAEKAARDSVRRAAVVEDVAGYLREACRSDTCRISFVVDKNPPPKAEEPAAREEPAAQPETTPAENPFMPPALGEECAEFCGACEEGAKKGKKKKDAMCEKIEARCGCEAHAEAVAEAERLFAEQIAKESAERAAQAAKDSVQRAATAQRSKEAAQRIFDFCEKETAAPLCSVTVVLDRAWFAIVDLRLFKPAPPPPPPAPVVVQQPVAQPAPRYAPAPQEEKRDEEKKSNLPMAESHGWLKPHHGVTIVLEGLKEREIAEGLPVDREDYDDEYGESELETGSFILGFFKLTHLGTLFSFQRGVNIGWSSGSYDIDSRYIYEARYDNFFLEVPLELRLGYPGAGPFLSASAHIRKPIASHIRIDGYWSEDEWSDWDAYQVTDWDIFLYFGIGLELTRHAALQYRGLWHSVATYKHTDENTQYGGQLALDVAW